LAGFQDIFSPNPLQPKEKRLLCPIKTIANEKRMIANGNKYLFNKGEKTSD